jgi:acyl carrier protein
MSQNDDVGFEIRRLVAEMLCTDAREIDDAVPLVDYGLDSLRAMSLVVVIEQQFSVIISDAELEQLTTTAQIADFLLRAKQ